MAMTAGKLFGKYNQVSSFTLKIRMGNTAEGSGSGMGEGEVMKSYGDFICDHR